MKPTTIITTIGLFLIFIYSVRTMLRFYGFAINDYGTYLAFYAFLLVSLFMLPRYYA